MDKKEMKDEIVCKHCAAKDAMKKGVRKLSSGKRQMYLCMSCGKRFSLGLSRKRFDAHLILDAVCLYNQGYSYEGVASIISRKRKRKISGGSVERWVKEYSLGFLDVRDKIVRKYGRDLIIEKAYVHSGLVYNFKMHKGKLKEYAGFSGLRDFVFEVAKGVDDNGFNGERCSQIWDMVSVNVAVKENTKLNNVIGGMLKIVKNNKKRHSVVEDLMLYCDRDTVAVEVPVWYWDKKRDVGVCGHIDVLQVKFGKVWVLDYKPNAAAEKFEKVISQLYNYAVALSFRSKVSLDDIRCGWFDAAKIFTFKPLEVRIGK